MSCHGAATAAKDWVVCLVFKRTKPGHGGRGREDEAEEVPSSPVSSCVTDNSSDGNQEEDGEQSSNALLCLSLLRSHPALII
jgi:hypothetical protein